MAVQVLTRLRFSSEEIRRVESLVANHLRFKDVRNMKESTLKRFLRQEHLASTWSFTAWIASRATGGSTTTASCGRSWRRCPPGICGPRGC